MVRPARQEGTACGCIAGTWRTRHSDARGSASRKNSMIAIVCTFLTAIGFYFSIGLGDQWWVAWLAPIPVLWLAFGEMKPWTAFFSAFLGYALGALNIVPAYAGAMPFVVVLAIGGPALL